MKVKLQQVSEQAEAERQAAKENAEKVVSKAISQDEIDKVREDAGEQLRGALSILNRIPSMKDDLLRDKPHFADLKEEALRDKMAAVHRQALEKASQKLEIARKLVEGKAELIQSKVASAIKALKDSGQTDTQGKILAALERIDRRETIREHMEALLSDPDFLGGNLSAMNQALNAAVIAQDEVAYTATCRAILRVSHGSADDDLQLLAGEAYRGLRRLTENPEVDALQTAGSKMTTRLEGILQQAGLFEVEHQLALMKEYADTYGGLHDSMKQAAQDAQLYQQRGY